jgi:hypothetical protein
MLLILSGEGPTDLGSCRTMLGSCSEADFQPGPMAVLLDQALSPLLGYSMLHETPTAVNFISEAGLSEYERQLKENRRGVVLPGKKGAKETAYFTKNAWALGALSHELEQASEDKGIAVLFRDCDGTRSSGTSLWQDKCDSMQRGFQRAGYPRGVPMLPKPKSEAWLLCAAKKSPYQHCAVLEGLSGNDDSPNAAKKKLDAAFGGHRTGAELCDWLEENLFDSTQARSMPSYAAFHDRLLETVSDVLH